MPTTPARRVHRWARPTGATGRLAAAKPCKAALQGEALQRGAPIAHGLEAPMAEDEQQAGPALVMDATPNPEDDDAPPPPSRRNKPPPPRAASSASSAQKKLAKSASTMALHAARLPRGRTPPPDTDSVRAVAASTASLSHLRQLNRRYVTAPSSGFFPPLPEKKEKHHIARQVIEI